MKLPSFILKLRWMIGKPIFNPHYQERTDGMKDIIKAKERRDGKNNKLAK